MNKNFYSNGIIAPNSTVQFTATTRLLAKCSI